MSMTTIDISLAELRAMLDGGEDEDWIVIAKVRPEGNGARVRLLLLDGTIVEDIRVFKGDSMTVHYTLNVVG